MPVDAPLQKFRPRCAQRLAEILKPDALDEETRRQILRNVCADAAVTTNDGGCSVVSEEVKLGGSSGTGGNFSTMLRDRVATANSELVTAMTKRLKMLEAQQQAYRLELKEKTEKLNRMQTECEAEKSRREEAETLVVELFSDKEELEKQIMEMKEFLADYGLQWVGNAEGESGGGSSRTPKERAKKSPATLAAETSPIPNREMKRFDLYAGDYTSEAPSPRPESSSLAAAESRSTNISPARGECSLPVSMEILQKNARILSDHVGFKEVATNGKRGAIKDRDVVQIVVYKDGICVNSGPFRPFGWPLCDAVLNDIADGYYPYEFKQRYPDGFPIEIVDQTSVCCTAVGTRPKNDKVQGTERMREGGYQPVSREEFLKRLPTTRITAGGRIVDVQGEIAKIIGCDKGGPSGSAEPDDASLMRHVTASEQKKRGNVSKSDGECGAPVATGTETPNNRCNNTRLQLIEGLVAVQLRFPCGKRLVLNLSPEDTIGDLRREVRLAMPSFTTEYKICLPFPAKTLGDDSKTLAELGLLGTCTLMIQPPRETKS
ncbi:hypothetical protein, conserved [Trypanosoma brucei gambiense DAL972]|uniref:UBX domain-containing protein 11 n=2 Tax=Trypanosoma brucei TaxID=5691 RepID=D0A458_TRYB9|nr:hypothetical protein, conserved [Trypanosoma brucei gambiense DAL972]RHW69097.1 SEP domain/UBX domain containing protein [Trypanosoma brucei equiperdum]CBH16052.1 hypothetical protein, conserved [Trypanosoma brucei gambiense DAL972]|eukprot:XP_011778316.1 hypothetical protein, conserved [Trypanosoma brucei gambiense DAL972]